MSCNDTPKEGVRIHRYVSCHATLRWLRPFDGTQTYVGVHMPGFAKSTAMNGYCFENTLSIENIETYH